MLQPMILREKPLITNICSIHWEHDKYQQEEAEVVEGESNTVTEQLV